jgi:ribose transport system permease protein
VKEEETRASGQPPRRGPRRWPSGEYLGLAVVLVLLVLAFGLATRHFLTPTTLRTIANQVPAGLLLATGMTLVLVAGGIDLSVGSVLGLCGIVLGQALAHGWPLTLALAAAVGVGGLAGFLNGWLTVRWALPSFIVTLGVLEVARGAAYMASDSRTVYVGSALEGIAGHSVLGVRLPFFVAVLAVVAAHVVLLRTVFGRYLVAIGTNEEAVRLAGVDPAPVKIRVFVLSGLAAGLAAVFNTARLAAADPNAGTGAELQAIAAAVIGGTSLMGGRGSAVASGLGVLIMAVLGAGLAQVGAQEPTKRVVTGAVIVVAALLDYYRRRARVSEG